MGKEFQQSLFLTSMALSQEYLNERYSSFRGLRNTLIDGGFDPKKQKETKMQNEQKVRGRSV